MSKLSLTRNFTAMFSRVAFFSLVALGAGLCLGMATALAAEDTVTEEQIVRALAPAKAPLTRSLSAAPQQSVSVNASEGRFVQTIRGRATRSLSTSEREEIAAIATDKPKIDLEITFQYDSADISAKSLPAVQALGKALTNSDLKGSTFIVAGHTDAAGSEAYNQELSERRADSIKRYLVEKYAIAGGDLVTVGYGKSKLKDTSNPMAEVNRRVQVVNMASKTAESK
jgi:outer membrane protein OmpA-like peptidoglycan-associated protein